jgi:hypothetical protein
MQNLPHQSRVMRDEVSVRGSSDLEKLCNDFGLLHFPKQTFPKSAPTLLPRSRRGSASR